MNCAEGNVASLYQREKSEFYTSISIFDWKSSAEEERDDINCLQYGLLFYILQYGELCHYFQRILNKIIIL